MINFNKLLILIISSASWHGKFFGIIRVADFPAACRRVVDEMESAKTSH